MAEQNFIEDFMASRSWEAPAFESMEQSAPGDLVVVPRELLPAFRSDTEDGFGDFVISPDGRTQGIPGGPGWEIGVVQDVKSPFLSECRRWLGRTVVPVMVAGSLYFLPGGVNEVRAATFNVTTQAQLSAAINTANGNAEDDIININSGITLGSELPLINSNIVFDGGGVNTVSGNNAYRVFFVRSGTVTFQNMTIANGYALGGTGGTAGNYGGSGGGGAGLGAGLFVYGGNVTVDNVTFTGNVASGGTGGSTAAGYGYGGGGGGLGGAGGSSFHATQYYNGGGGGGGLFAGSDGGAGNPTGVAGGAGLSSGGFGGGGGGGGGSPAAVGGAGGNGSAGGPAVGLYGGGGGGGSPGSTPGGNPIGGTGGFGGGGGGAGGYQYGSDGGGGGFGGGGGGTGIGSVPADSSGGAGGFGGGGGGGYGPGGAGGFGGGGGGSFANTGGTGGYGAGNGGATRGGGGGAGFGGAIFAMAGNLILQDVTFNGNQANNGAGGGGGATNGTGRGGGVFICTAAEDAACSATVDGSSCGLTFAGNGATTGNADYFDGSGVIAGAGGCAPTVLNVTSPTLDGFYNVPDVINITVQFSEAVNVTGTPQLTLETGAADAVVNYSSGTGTDTLTFQYSVAAGHTSGDLDYWDAAALSLNGGTIRNASLADAILTLAAPGAAGSLGANKALVIDTTAPTITSVNSVTPDGTYGVGAAINVTVNFSENVTLAGGGGLLRAALNSGGNADSAFAPPNIGPTMALSLLYTVGAGQNSGDLSCASPLALMAAAILTDAAGNNANLIIPGGNNLGDNRNIIIDTTAPTVVDVNSPTPDGPYNTGDIINVTVQFTENVNVTGTPQLTLETGGADAVVNYFAGSGTNTLTFQYTVAAGHTSADLDYVNTGSLAPNGGTIRDAVLNDADLTLPAVGGAGSLGGNKALVIDTTAPTVMVVNSPTPNGLYGTGGVIDVTIMFSETVNVTGIPQLTLETGTADAVIDYTGGSGTDIITLQYTVAAGHTSPDLDYAGVGSLVPGLTIRDAAGNDANLALPVPGAPFSLGAMKALVIDAIAPTVVNVDSTTADGLYNAGDTIDVTVQFTEIVNVTGTPQLTLETGATDAVVDYAGGSGSDTLTFQYTVAAAHNSADLDYADVGSLVPGGGTIQDAAGNTAILTLPAPGAAGSLGANRALVIDNTAPTIASITSTTLDGTYGAGTAINITVTFSENVFLSGAPFGSLRVSLNAGATAWADSAAPIWGPVNPLVLTYTVAAGDNSADLTSDGVAIMGPPVLTDEAGNNADLTLPTVANLGDTSNIVIDTDGPTVANVDSASLDGLYGEGGIINVTVQFTEIVTVTGTPQLTLETGAADATIDYNAGSGTNTLTFQYTVAADHTSADLGYIGAGSLVPNGGTIQDGVGNAATLTLPAPGAAGSLSANRALVIDGIAPTVANVDSTSGDGLYNTGDVINIAVQFSEIVNVVGTPQLTLETGAADAVVNYNAGSGTNTLIFAYTVAAGDTSADLDYAGTGALGLNGGTIQDPAGNAATLTLAAPGAAGSLGANRALVIDTTAPTVTDVNSPTADGSYTTGGIINVTVQFTEAVDVTGTPQLTLETGAADAVVDYTGGTGTDTLTFQYTVAAGHTSADLDYIGVGALALNGGTIQDPAGNNATLTPAAPGAAGSLGANRAFVIDTTAPTVANVDSTTVDGSYGAGNVIDVTIQFTEAVIVTGLPQLTLETGGADAVVDYSAGSGTDTLTFQYTVAAGHASADLDYFDVGSLALNGGTIQDAAGNNATLTLSAPGAPTSLGANRAIVIDTTAPTVADVNSPTADGPYGAGGVINVTVQFTEIVTVAGVPQLTLETGVADAVVNYTGGTGTDTLTFQYTVAAGENNNDLDYVDAASLALNGGTIQDAVNNNATLTLPVPGTANSLGANRALVVDTTPPAVDAGPNSAEAASFNLAGSANDAGSGLAGTLWTRISGAGNAYFGDDTSVTSSCAFDFNDTYVLRLTATDNVGNVSTADVTITWMGTGSHTVDTLIDENDGSCADGDCSLRDAIAVATPGDSIGFALGLNGTITLGLGELVIASNLTIIGPTADSIVVSGNNASRVFNVTGGTVTMSNLTVSDGNGGGVEGGGILNVGDLTLNNCLVANNSAILGGGGIANTGGLTMNSSTVSGNISNIDGGGIWSTSFFTLNDVTIFNNTGIAAGPAIMATVAGDILNSIIAGGCAGVNHNSQGFNIETDTTCFGAAPLPTDQQNTNPLLNALADNGGPTMTHMPQLGSPAIDMGGLCGGTDQRGIVRPVDGDGNGSVVCDVGAFELSSGTLQFDAAAYTVAETGALVTVTVTRINGSDGAASVNYTTADNTATAGNDYTAAAGTLNWAANDMTAQTFTVNVADDDIDEPNETVDLTLVGFTGALEGAQSTATLTITDNDVFGFTVTPTAGLVTTEAGGTASFTVRLNSEPMDNVTIPISSSDVGEGTVSTGSLLFTAGTWTANQTVTVTGVDDGTLDGSQAYTIILGAATSPGDANYNGANPPDVSVTNNESNAPPTAVADAYTTTEDVPLNVAASGVLGNDTDPNGNPLTAVWAGGPTNGALTLNANGSFTYTPAANWNGTDSFTYMANDGTFNSNAATVTITVNLFNDPPVANADAYSVNEDAVLNIAAPGLLANDTDLEGDPLTAEMGAWPVNGMVTLYPDGSFAYTPIADFSGTETFTYHANDGTSDSATPATVTITVAPLPDPPVITQGDTVTVDMDEDGSPTAFALALDATDPDGDTLTWSVASQAANGTATASGTGNTVNLTYAPAADFNGSDSFEVEVSDGGLTDTVTVNVTINAVNDAPVLDTTIALALADISEDPSANPGTAVTDILAGEYGLDDAVTDVDDGAEEGIAVVAADTANGVWEHDHDGDGMFTPFPAALAEDAALLLNDDVLIRFVPAADYNGSATITLRAWDRTSGGNGDEGVDTTVNGGITAFGELTSIAEIAVAPVNDPPVIVAQFPITGSEDLPFPITVADFDVTDVDSNPADFVLLIQMGPNYTVTGNTVTPGPDFNGQLTVMVSVGDGSDSSAVFPAIVDIQSVPDAPIFVSDPNTVAEEGEPYLYAVSISDPDTGDVWTVSAETLPEWLGLSPSAGGGTLAGTPLNGDAGSYDVQLTATDTFGQTAVQVFTIVVAEKEDYDEDGIPDAHEEELGMNPDDPSDADFDNDNDGLTNLDEFGLETNPDDRDTDDDGANDGAEVAAGTDPLDGDWNHYHVSHVFDREGFLTDEGFVFRIVRDEDDPITVAIAGPDGVDIPVALAGSGVADEHFVFTWTPDMAWTEMIENTPFDGDVTYVVTFRIYAAGGDEPVRTYEAVWIDYASVDNMNADKSDIQWKFEFLYERDADAVVRTETWFDPEWGTELEIPVVGPDSAERTLSFFVPAIPGGLLFVDDADNNLNYDPDSDTFDINTGEDGYREVETEDQVAVVVRYFDFGTDPFDAIVVELKVVDGPNTGAFVRYNPIRTPDGSGRQPDAPKFGLAMLTAPDTLPVIRTAWEEGRVRLMISEPGDGLDDFRESDLPVTIGDDGLIIMQTHHLTAFALEMTEAGDDDVTVPDDGDTTDPDDGGPSDGDSGQDGTGDSDGTATTDGGGGGGGCFVESTGRVAYGPVFLAAFLAIGFCVVFRKKILR